MIQSKQPIAARRRYSNYDDTFVGPPSIDDIDPTLPGGSSYNDPGGSSGSVFNWGGLNQTLGIIGNAITSIFSPSSKWTSQMYSEQYKQEKRTNTILWVVIGLMAALGVVLLVRKH